MQGNRSTDSGPEQRLRQALFQRGHRYRKNFAPAGVRCRVDIVFPSRRLAVFVDGCFWHGCPVHGNQPRTNSGYWTAKLARNHERDQANDTALEEAGWRVLRIWEHEDTVSAVRQVEEALVE